MVEKLSACQPFLICLSPFPVENSTYFLGMLERPVSPLDSFKQSLCFVTGWGIRSSNSFSNLSQSCLNLRSTLNSGTGRAHADDPSSESGYPFQPQFCPVRGHSCNYIIKTNKAATTKKSLLLFHSVISFLFLIFFVIIS